MYMLRGFRRPVSKYVCGQLATNGLNRNICIIYLLPTCLNRLVRSQGEKNTLNLVRVRMLSILGQGTSVFRFLLQSFRLLENRTLSIEHDHSESTERM